MRKQCAAVLVIAIAQVITAAQQFSPASPGTAVDPNTRFEVVAIKAIADASSPTMIRMTPGGLDSSVPVGVLLRQALQKPDYQMIGAPGWINTERYSIRATLPKGVSPAAMSVVLLNMLKDRFQLATHLEAREAPIFHLVMARGDGRTGPNLKPTSAECQAAIAERQAAEKRGGPPPPPPDRDACGAGRTGPGLLARRGGRIAQLVAPLSDLTGRPVIDKTGLTGLYDFTLEFAYEGRMPGLMGALGVPPGAPVNPDAPSLSAALQEQLGLKLEAARGPVEVVVIDKLEKPTLE